MQPFEYVAWLENTELPPDDEDYEWCAVIIVLADTIDDAQFWGDKLIRELCEASYDVFLRSSADPHVCSLATAAGHKHPCPNYPALTRPGNEMLAMPVVAYGESATAEYIGW